MSREPKHLCFCGYAYNGKLCRYLQKKYPALKNGWHRIVAASKESKEKPK